MALSPRWAGGLAGNCGAASLDSQLRLAMGAMGQQRLEDWNVFEDRFRDITVLQAFNLVARKPSFTKQHDCPPGGNRYVKEDAGHRPIADC